MNITSVPSPNFHARRRPVVGIVIHCMEGTMQGTADLFTNRGQQESYGPVSAHYGIGRDGSVVQYVSESDCAYHAGRVEGATAQIVLDRPGVNPNDYMIGIEHEDPGNEDLTSAQRASSAELIREICGRYSIPIDRQHIVGHHEIFAPKTCPDAINVDALVEAAAAGSSNA